MVGEADSPPRDAAQVDDCQLSRNQYKPVTPEASIQCDRTSDSYEVSWPLVRWETKLISNPALVSSCEYPD